MFESTAEMIVTLVLLVVAVFPFVYIPLKNRKRNKEKGPAG